MKRRWPALDKFFLMSFPEIETSQTAVEALTAQIRTTTTPDSGCRTTGVFKIVRTFDQRTLRQPIDVNQLRKQVEERVAAIKTLGHICFFDIDADP